MEYTANGIKGDYIIYRDKPLVRNKNMICYGSMEDDYILQIMIMGNKKADDSTLDDKPEVPNCVLVQVVSTDESKPIHERLAKQFEKNDLYDAFEIGLIWLDKLNKN